MIHYKVVLDSGYCSFMGAFPTREAAHFAARKHNVHADEQKRRGDLVSLRRAIGVIKIIPKSPKLAKPQRKKNKKSSIKNI